MSLYLNLSYPNHDDLVEVQIEQNASYKTLGALIKDNAPISFKGDQLLTEYAVFVNKQTPQGKLFVDLSLEQPINITLSNDDTLHIREGISPHVLDAVEPAAVQVLTFNENGAVADADALAHILNGYKYRNLPVIVLSVAGPFRSGKSFLLNFLLKYLSSDDDLASLDGMNVSSGGFKWEHGVERHTVGMWMWNKPFIRNVDGKDVAIVLVDTQGTFDRHTTMEQNTRIFALTALISSKQIYNIKEKISEDILHHMHLFTEYGAMLAQRRDGKKPFQHLDVLVRDWNFDNFDEGREGGNKYLNEHVLSCSDDDVDEIQSVRKWLKDCYEELTCFLMPHPGLIISRKTFDGDLSKLEDNFNACMKEYVADTFGSLEIKRIGETNITCSSLRSLFEGYVAAFNEGELPKIETLYEATARLGRDALRKEVVDSYETAMEAAFGPDSGYVSEKLVLAKHNATVQSVLAVFDERELLGSERDKAVLRKDLKSEFDVRLLKYQQLNRGKDYLRGARTPLVFVAISFLLSMFGNAIYVLGLESFGTLFTVVSWLAIVISGVWLLSYYLDNLAELRQMLNDFADSAIEMAQQHTMPLVMNAMKQVVAKGAAAKPKVAAPRKNQ